MRPKTPLSQQFLKDFLRLWDAATGEEKQRLMPLIVDRVEMHEKERGFCRLLFTAQNPRLLSAATSKNVVINSRLGAGRLVVANYPPISFPDFEVPPISRKTWKPRPEAEQH